MSASARKCRPLAPAPPFERPLLPPVALGLPSPNALPLPLPSSNALPSLVAPPLPERVTRIADQAGSGNFSR
ncbi:MAG: hypothetical protein BGO51_23425 [Rhodospirillales bacterium 69-11]|nr:hypothetical protein [Rhodospirillales bacterium]OJW22767.1 MAG: hypothetical protein BGO51_23425 [Rhodospirillales bacterium 69-11]